MNQFKIPADLGRISKNIEREEGFQTIQPISGEFSL